MEPSPPLSPYVQKCPADGSCMFHAVAAALNGFMDPSAGESAVVAHLAQRWDRVTAGREQVAHDGLRFLAFLPYLCHQDRADTQLENIACEAKTNARQRDPFVDVLRGCAEPRGLSVVQRISLLEAGMQHTTWGDSFTLDNLCRLLRIAAVVRSSTWNAGTRAAAQSYVVLNADTAEAGTEPPVAVCFLQLSVNHYDVLTWNTAVGKQVFMVELLAARRGEVPPELADKVPAHLWADSVEALLATGLPADPLLAHVETCVKAFAGLQLMAKDFGDVGALLAQEAATAQSSQLDTPKHKFLGGPALLPPQAPDSVVALQCGLVVEARWNLGPLAESAELGPGAGQLRPAGPHGPAVLRGGSASALCAGFGAFAPH